MWCVCVCEIKYRTYSAILSEILTGVFNEARETGKLPDRAPKASSPSSAKKGPRDNPTN